MHFRFSLLVTLLAAIALSRSAVAGLPIVVASDSASDPAYATQPDHDYSIDNGGFGYNTWTPLGGVSGGGTYMEGPGVNSRGVPTAADYSFAIYSGNNTNGYAISRPLQNPLSFGEFDITTRFDTNGSNVDLFNLRSGNNTSSFGAGELLSFGLVDSADPGQFQLTYTDLAGVHVMPSGNARGNVYSWNVDFNAAAGTYSLTVSQIGGAFTDTVSGTLEASGTTVGSFGVINTSHDNVNFTGQNVIFNNAVFSVPEPGTYAAASLALFGLFVTHASRRRRLANV